jgi:hypothetical protein
MSITTCRVAVCLSVIFAFLVGYFLGVNLVFPGSVKKLFRDASDTSYFAAINQPRHSRPARARRCGGREAAARGEHLALLSIRYARG